MFGLTKKIRYSSWEISRSFVTISDQYEVIRGIKLRWDIGAPHFLVSFSGTKKEYCYFPNVWRLYAAPQVLVESKFANAFYDSKSCYGFQFSTRCWIPESSALYLSYRVATTNRVTLILFSNVVGITKVTKVIEKLAETTTSSFLTFSRLSKILKAKPLRLNIGTAHLCDFFQVIKKRVSE